MNELALTPCRLALLGLSIFAAITTMLVTTVALYPAYAEEPSTVYGTIKAADAVDDHQGSELPDNRVSLEGDDVTVKVKSRTTADDGSAQFTFDGSIQQPTVTVTRTKTTPEKTRNIRLTEGTDYELAYSDNVDAGQATVTVRGIGEYTGERTVTFIIAQASIAKARFPPSKTRSAQARRSSPCRR